MADPSLLRFRYVLHAALAHLEAHRQQINDLNVFPVADGDTGDNMALTLGAVLEEVDRLSHQGELDDIGRNQIVDSVARAALLGARGNSGVILSQLIRGAAEELISRPGELIDPVLVGSALARAADRAYASVREPAEGTILTVVREMAHRVVSDVAHSPDPRLGANSPNSVQDASIATILESALSAGREAVERGPDLLPVLRDAGVVDAGGYGVTVIFAGVIAALKGEPPPEIEQPVRPRVTHPHHQSSTFRYCTNFAVTGRDLDSTRMSAKLERFGDSALIVGDHSTLRVHIHTDDPGAVTALFAEIGDISRVDVADMHEQVRTHQERMAESRTQSGLVAVVSGDGIKEQFQALGAITLDGGRTLNPSTYDLLAAIHDCLADEVLLLPNSKNVFLAAEKAAELAEKKVAVIPSSSQQAGLLSAVAFNAEKPIAENALDMDEVLSNVRCGAVAEAARDDAKGRFRRGESLGFIDEKLVVWGSVEETLKHTIDKLSTDSELLTVLSGDCAPLPEATVATLVPTGIELEYWDGGQPNYWWLLAAER